MRTELAKAVTALTEDEYRKKALAILKRLGWSNRPKGKKWEGVGYFGVPAATMRALADEGYCEMRKKNGHSPCEYRPTGKVLKEAGE